MNTSIFHFKTKPAEQSTVANYEAIELKKQLRQRKFLILIHKMTIFRVS